MKQSTKQTWLRISLIILGAITGYTFAAEVIAIIPEGQETALTNWMPTLGAFFLAAWSWLTTMPDAKS